MSRPELKALDYLRLERGLTTRIAEAEARAQQASIPPVLRGRISKHAAREWAKLADNVAVKRDIIRTILSIGLFSVGRGRRAFDPNRVRLAWTYGVDTPPSTTATRKPASAARTAREPAPRKPIDSIKTRVRATTGVR
jgi:hypothetical protein